MFSIFSCACCPSVYLFGEKCLFGRSAHFLIGFGFCFFCIEQRQLILEIKPLLVASLASISSCSIGCLFILLIVSFVVQKLLSLIRSHLFIFAFVYITLGLRV